MAAPPSHRPDRVANLVREVLAELITFSVKDPRVTDVVLTDVEITGDLREARIFFRLPGGSAGKDRAIEGLRSATGYLRRELGRRIRLRVTPELAFRYDPSADYGQRIEEKLAELGLGPHPDAPDEPDAED